MICPVRFLLLLILVASSPCGLAAEPDGNATDPLAELESFLAKPRDERGEIADQPFASIRLSQQQTSKAQQLLWEDHQRLIRQTRTDEMKAGKLVDGELTMPFAYKTFGEKPNSGRSLYISMHGGGGAPKRVNDSQWENQKRLYTPPEGVYLAPRAPTDTWNLWHQRHIDGFFDRLIENLVVFEDVDPNRVYLMGYSAGGDGAYQLAPRMADRWAAVAMMAGHPGDSSPLGLRNIGFAIYVGGKDAAYKRNEIAAQWKTKLDELQQSDPEGYQHQVTIYANKGHWMDREDASSIDWMRTQERDPLPQKIVWKQDDVTHRRYYWLATPEPTKGTLVTATRTEQSIDIETADVTKLTILLNDKMLNLDEPVRVTHGGAVVHEAIVARTIAMLAKTLAERGDPELVFAGAVSVEL